MENLAEFERFLAWLLTVLGGGMVGWYFAALWYKRKPPRCNIMQMDGENRVRIDTGYEGCKRDTGFGGE
jgi:hypothetical protein